MSEWNQYLPKKDNPVGIVDVMYKNGTVTSRLSADDVNWGHVGRWRYSEEKPATKTSYDSADGWLRTELTTLTPNGRVDVAHADGEIENDTDAETVYWDHVTHWRYSKEQPEPATETSDGSSADYYKLPPGAEQLQDLISKRNMNSQIGEIFRACYRYGRVEHSPQLRDAKKILFYAQAEVARLEKYDAA